MKQALVTVRPFERHGVGDLITDAAAVKALLSGERQSYVVATTLSETSAAQPQEIDE